VEIKEIIKTIKKRKRMLALVGILGAALGIFVYFYIPSYIATGSFYVTRTTQKESPEYFTYEGYYSQQTALAYTNTVIALLESHDLKSKTLRTLDLPIDERRLRKLDKNAKVKKSGPQLVTLTVKGKTKRNALDTWLAMSENLLNTVIETNKEGDSSLKVLKITEQPIMKEGYRSIQLNILAGFGLSSSLAAFIVILKEYLD
jgi:capsular polysaccharide biosynthesis protein